MKGTTVLGSCPAFPQHRFLCTEIMQSEKSNLDPIPDTENPLLGDMGFENIFYAIFFADSLTKSSCCQRNECFTKMVNSSCGSQFLFVYLMLLAGLQRI